MGAINTGMKILVTGGAGCIGSRACAVLHDVTFIGKRYTGRQ